MPAPMSTRFRVVQWRTMEGDRMFTLVQETLLAGVVVADMRHAMPAQVFQELLEQCLQAAKQAQEDL